MDGKLDSLGTEQRYIFLECPRRLAFFRGGVERFRGNCQPCGGCVSSIYERVAAMRKLARLWNLWQLNGFDVREVNIRSCGIWVLR